MTDSGWLVVMALPLEATSFACAKFVSDGANHAAASDWQSNLHRAAKHFIELYLELRLSPSA
jgi:hypothetical protein